MVTGTRLGDPDAGEGGGGGATACSSPDSLGASSQTRDHMRRVSSLPQSSLLCFFPPTAVPFFYPVPIPPPFLTSLITSQ